MANQSMLQNFIQNTAGTQTTAQGATPTANNGNPNTAYNWTSYVPTVTQGGGGGGLPSVNFDLLSSQAPASSAGYTPPFTADPYAAMVMAGMPRAQGNENVNRILSGFLGNGSGGGGGGFTPNPGTGTPPVGPPGTTPPTSGYPLPGGATRPPVGPRGTPVGPISGPIEQDSTALARNYANAQPVTSIEARGNGRWARSDWMNVPEFRAASESSNTGNSFFDGLSTALRGLSGTIGNVISGEVDGFMADARNFLDDITLQNGGAGLLRAGLDAIFPGLGNLIPQEQGETFRLSPEQEAQITDKLNTQLTSLMDAIRIKGGESAMAKLDQLSAQQGQAGSDARYQAAYDSAPRMTNTDWNRTMDRVGFINMFAQGRANETTSGMLRELQDRFAQVAQNQPRRVVF